MILEFEIYVVMLFVFEGRVVDCMGVVVLMICFVYCFVCSLVFSFFGFFGLGVFLSYEVEWVLIFFVVGFVLVVFVFGWCCY